MKATMLKNGNMPELDDRMVYANIDKEEVKGFLRGIVIARSEFAVGAGSKFMVRWNGGGTSWVNVNDNRWRLDQ